MFFSSARGGDLEEKTGTAYRPFIGYELGRYADGWKREGKDMRKLVSRTLGWLVGWLCFARGEVGDVEDRNSLLVARVKPSGTTPRRGEEKRSA